MAKLKTIKIKFGAIKVIKEHFPTVSERSIYYYLKGPEDVTLWPVESRERCISVRQYARQFERK